MEEGEGETNTVNGECSMTFIACAKRDVVQSQFLENVYELFALVPLGCPTHPNLVNCPGRFHEPCKQRVERKDELQTVSTTTPE